MEPQWPTKPKLCPLGPFTEKLPIPSRGLHPTANENGLGQALGSSLDTPMREVLPL